MKKMNYNTPEIELLRLTATNIVTASPVSDPYLPEPSEWELLS